MEGLERPPLPGSRGQEIFETVSRQAWEEWQAHQTMLINEKQLNMLEPSVRTYLLEQMNLFMDNKAVDDAEGYTPE